MPREKGWQIPGVGGKNPQYLSERTMEVQEQVSTFSMKMKSLFHAIRAAKLWNSFPVGGSGGKRERTSWEAEP